MREFKVGDKCTHSNEDGTDRFTIEEIFIGYNPHDSGWEGTDWCSPVEKGRINIYCLEDIKLDTEGETMREFKIGDRVISGDDIGLVSEINLNKDYPIKVTLEGMVISYYITYTLDGRQFKYEDIILLHLEDEKTTPSELKFQFQEGDLVTFGGLSGVVGDKTSYDYTYPIRVNFENNTNNRFTIDGRCDEDQTIPLLVLTSRPDKDREFTIKESKLKSELEEVGIQRQTIKEIFENLGFNG